MLEKIEELAKKGILVSIYPMKLNSVWYWIAGVYINGDTKATWIDSKNNLPKAAYNTYTEAYNAVLDYCAQKKKS